MVGPEEGSIDYVPYDMIDALWNRIEEEQSDPDCGIEMKRRYFQLMKVSEVGMLSARALKSD